MIDQNCRVTNVPKCSMEIHSSQFFVSCDDFVKIGSIYQKKSVFLALFYICWLVLDINPSFCHSHSFQVWKNQSVNKQNLISVYVTNSCELCISLITRRLTFKLLKNTRHALFNHFRYWKRGKKINQNCDHVPLNRALLERGGYNVLHNFCIDLIEINL